MTKANLFFPTPVWTSIINNYKETNEEIYNFIKNLQNLDNKGVKKSNIKGWHSSDFDMKDKVPKKFIEMISPKINEVLVDMDWNLKIQKVKISSMWAIINIGGAENARHHHGNNSLSAAYYVRAPEDAGEIVFYDPRPAPVYFHPTSNKPNELNAMVNSITPKEGLLVLFPSYLEHSVNPNLSDNERIVISFNISIL